MSTALIGEKILQKRGYKKLKPQERKNLILAYKKSGKRIPESAFDLVHFSDVKDIIKKLNSILLIEAKSTNNDLDKKFSGHFFGITENQEKLGKILPQKYKFAFVNIISKNVMILTYSQVQKRIKRKHMVAHVTI